MFESVPEAGEGEVGVGWRTWPGLRVAAVHVGWGMESVEGVCWNKVCWVGFGIVVFELGDRGGVGTVKRDAQGGSGFAAYMTAFWTFTVGIVQTLSQ